MQNVQFSATLLDSFRKHSDAIHKELKIYVCKLCEYSVMHAGNCKIHIDAIHKGFKPYKCELWEYFAAIPNCLNTYIVVAH